MENIDNKPLLSFCLIAFNQEKFIHEAIVGAFSQSYSPLEIVLSDDCSTDKTFEIMEEMAASYKGPHKIITNKNKHNIGLVPHINTVVDLANGLWYIIAAGDDISLKNRTEVISKIFLNNNVYGIGCSSYLIDNEGAITGTQHYNDSIFGSNSAWHRKCFEHFGDLPNELGCEDNVLFFRSLLLGGVAFSDIVTVKYRMFDSISNKSYSTLKDYYAHKLKINKLIKETLHFRVNELNKYDLDEISKLKLNKIFEKKIENISFKINSMNIFLFLTEKSFLYKINFIFLKNGHDKLSLKRKFKLLFLTNSLYAKIYSYFSPNWLRINYPNNEKNRILEDVRIKTLNEYIEETDINTHW